MSCSLSLPCHLPVATLSPPCRPPVALLSHLPCCLPVACLLLPVASLPLSCRSPVVFLSPPCRLPVATLSPSCRSLPHFTVACLAWPESSSQPPDPRQYYTRIPRHGLPRRPDAILIRQQLPNIPWTYYDTIQIPISDHALVLLGVRWRTGAPDPPRRKPHPKVTKWYTKQFQRFTNTISTLPVTNNDQPLR